MTVCVRLEGILYGADRLSHRDASRDVLLTQYQHLASRQTPFSAPQNPKDIQIPEREEPSAYRTSPSCHPCVPEDTISQHTCVLVYWYTNRTIPCAVDTISLVFCQVLAQDEPLGVLRSSVCFGSTVIRTAACGCAKICMQIAPPGDRHSHMVFFRLFVCLGLRHHETSRTGWQFLRPV